MFRPTDNIIIDSEENFITHNPIIPCGVFAITSNENKFKVGNGINKWSALSYFAPSVQGYETNIESNWESNSIIYPTGTLLIELDDLSNNSTGRFKISDGSSVYNDLPWFGIDFNLSNFNVGESIEFNGVHWDPIVYLKPNELQVATFPVGKFHRDDGTWAYMDNFPTNFTTIEAIQGLFNTVYIGSFPTEPTSITLTSDGNTLFVDGQKVWTEYNDGEGSGLDADTLDGHHHTAFTLSPNASTSGHVVTFGSSSNILIDSGYTVYDFLPYTRVLYKGVIDCSLNPLFPDAELGDFYIVSVSGLIGGEFGYAVDIGDNIICNFATVENTYDECATCWDIIANYTEGNIIGPSSSTDNNIVIFDGDMGKSVKDSGYKISDFATIDDITNLIDEDDALAYSIAFGG